MRLPFGTRSRRGGEHVGQELLSAYLDGQVTAAERAYVEGHLAGCAVCRAELEALQHTVTLLRALPRVPVPRAFTLSENQVGIRRGTEAPSWLGGALRGLTAVAAVLLVAFIASTALRRPAWTPGETVARMAPTVPAAPGAPAAAPAALALETAPAAAPRPLATVRAQPTPVPQPTAMATSAQPAAKAPEGQAVPAAPPGATPTGRPELRSAAPAASPTALPPTQAPEPALQATVVSSPSPVSQEMGIAAAPPADQPLKAGAAAPRGAVETSPAPPQMTAEPLPATRALSSTLPSGVGVAYTDERGLWTLDRDAGLRLLVAGPGIGLPVISAGRTWIAYRVAVPGNAELWAVPWDGGSPRRLLAEHDLPAEDASSGYGARYFAAYRWVPGKTVLAVDVVLPPAGRSVQPRYELWQVSAASGARQRVLQSEVPIRPVYAPDGERFAVLLREPGPGQDGGLFLYRADGVGGQRVLRFAMGTVAREYDSRLAWQPDGQGLWAAIPDPARSAGGMTLYRVGADGQSGPGKALEALEAFWSPDVTRLAYTRAITGSDEVRELLLAGADGSGAQVYAPLRNGKFLGWGPDSTHFLYTDAGQVYVGSPGQPARRLGNAASVSDPRWIAADQLLSLHQVPPSAGDPGGWMLVWRSVDGRAASLQRLPPEVTFDVTSP